MERWIKRALVHLQHLARHLTDALRDAPPVPRLGRNGLENQEIQRSLHQITRFAHLFPLSYRQYVNTSALVNNQGESFPAPGFSDLHLCAGEPFASRKENVFTFFPYTCSNCGKSGLHSWGKAGRSRKHSAAAPEVPPGVLARWSIARVVLRVYSRIKKG